MSKHMIDIIESQSFEKHAVSNNFGQFLSHITAKLIQNDAATICRNQKRRCNILKYKEKIGCGGWI